MRLVEMGSPGGFPFGPLSGYFGDPKSAAPGLHNYIHPDDGLYPTTPEALSEVLAAKVAQEVAKLNDAQVTEELGRKLQALFGRALTPEDQNDLRSDIAALETFDLDVTKSRRGPLGNSSRFRGVTRHRRTKRWEAHIWDTKKQVYLGGFDNEQQAAKAHDVMAIKTRGLRTIINFKSHLYAGMHPYLERLTKDEVIQLLRAQSKAFSARRSSQPEELVLVEAAAAAAGGKRPDTATDSEAMDAFPQLLTNSMRHLVSPELTNMGSPGAPPWRRSAAAAAAAAAVAAAAALPSSPILTGIDPLAGALGAGWLTGGSPAVSGRSGAGQTLGGLTPVNRGQRGLFLEDLDAAESATMADFMLLQRGGAVGGGGGGGGTPGVFAAAMAAAAGGGFAPSTPLMGRSNVSALDVTDYLAANHRTAMATQAEATAAAAAARITAAAQREAHAAQQDLLFDVSPAGAMADGPLPLLGPHMVNTGQQVNGYTPQGLTNIHRSAVIGSHGGALGHSSSHGAQAAAAAAARGPFPQVGLEIAPLEPRIPHSPTNLPPLHSGSACMAAAAAGGGPAAPSAAYGGNSVRFVKPAAAHRTFSGGLQQGVLPGGVAQSPSVAAASLLMWPGSITSPLPNLGMSPGGNATPQILGGLPPLDRRASSGPLHCTSGSLGLSLSGELLGGQGLDDTYQEIQALDEQIRLLTQLRRIEQQQQSEQQQQAQQQQQQQQHQQLPPRGSQQHHHQRQLTLTVPDQLHPLPMHGHQPPAQQQQQQQTPQKRPSADAFMAEGVPALKTARSGEYPPPTAIQLSSEGHQLTCTLQQQVVVQQRLDGTAGVPVAAQQLQQQQPAQHGQSAATVGAAGGGGESGGGGGDAGGFAAGAAAGVGAGDLQPAASGSLLGGMMGICTTPSGLLDHMDSYLEDNQAEALGGVPIMPKMLTKSNSQCLTPSASLLLEQQQQELLAPPTAGSDHHHHHQQQQQQQYSAPGAAAAAPVVPHTAQLGTEDLLSTPDRLGSTDVPMNSTSLPVRASILSSGDPTTAAAADSNTPAAAAAPTAEAGAGAGAGAGAADTHGLAEATAAAGDKASDGQHGQTMPADGLTVVDPFHGMGLSMMPLMEDDLLLPPGAYPV